MSRAIDVEELLHILNEMDQTWEYGRAVSAIYVIVKAMPTLTPQNEWVRVEDDGGENNRSI